MRSPSEGADVISDPIVIALPRSVRTASFFLAIIMTPCLWAHDQTSDATGEDLTDYVDTRVGTKPWTKKIQLAGPELAEGHTYPGVGPPFAMTEWTPQTTTGAIPYWYDHDRIQGFRATHYPSGAVMHEYGSFTLMPMSGRPVFDPEERAAVYHHGTEIAKPHYYAVTLERESIRAEVTATSRSAIFRFTYPKSDASYIMLDFFHGGGHIEVDVEKGEIVGYNKARGTGTPEDFAGYFAVQLSKPIDQFQVRAGSDDHDAAAWVRFPTEKDEAVMLKAGTSFIDIQQARENLSREIPDWDFEAVKKQTQHAWTRELSKIKVSGGSEDEKVIFYSALYHCLLLPREFSEHGRYYSPYDGRVHKGVSYTDFSLWDTFRAQHPLLIFLAPDRVNAMIQSLLQSYDESGWIPKWPNPDYSNVMMGTHADAVIADAYIKGLRDYDVKKAYEATLKNAQEKGTGLYAARVGIEDYIRLGYVPADRHGESVGRTLEFAYDDYCIAQMAAALGKKADHSRYLQRSMNYQNVLDPATQLVRGRRSDGSWSDPGSRYISVWAGKTAESLAIYKWNHTFLVPHDVHGLIRFYGDEETFCTALDTLFRKEYYYVGDEFSMHAPYLYNYAGKAWKTQRTVRDLLSYYFAAGPDGLSGNDDCGQLSAWYIFGAMGFYPVAPGYPEYALTSPVFDEVVIQLPNRKRFVIRARNNCSKNAFIQSAALNGRPYEKSYLMHETIMKGGTLDMLMGAKPNERWGADPDHRPGIALPTFDQVQPPFLAQGERTFYEFTRVALATRANKGVIHYTLDGSEPDADSPRYAEPFTITSPCTLKAITLDEGNASAAIHVAFHRIPSGRRVTLHTRYSEEYPAGGAMGLIDYKTGSSYFHAPQWQGYEVADFEAVVDLGGMQSIRSLGLGVLQDINNWIFFPEVISFYVSADGRRYRLVDEILFDIHKAQSAVPRRSEMTVTLNDDAEYRYVKVKAKNHGACPAWHPYAGSKSWIFVDEVLIR